MKPVEQNPLGFYCPPNGTDPAYAAERDFERFIAYGMLRSFTDLSKQGFSDHALVDDEHRRGLREAFLAVVEGTLQYLWTGDFEIGQDNFDVDMFGDGCQVLIGNNEENPDERGTLWSWMPFRIDEDCIIFDLSCDCIGMQAGEERYGGDPTTLFLGMEAVKDRRKVREVINKAREVNDCPYRTGYQNDENDKLWKRVCQSKL